MLKIMPKSLPKSIGFLSEMIPFLLLLLLILYPSSFILSANTILGKIVAIAIILFYLSQDILIGILVALIFLCFYQSDIVSNICHSENFETTVIPESFATFTHGEDGPILPPNFTMPFSPSAPIKPSTSGNVHLAASPNDLSRINIQSESETVFKNQHCSKDLEFVYKNQIIKHPDAIKMLFQEIQFVSDKPCNPCDPTCSFSVVKNPPLPLEKTDRIGCSTRGKTAIEEAFEWANSWVVNKLEPYFGVGGGNTASYVE